jgi:hypothetical protein
MATFSLSYRASSDLTSTNIGVATSATWVQGWKSAPYDNTSNLDLDARLSGVIKTGSSAPTTNTQILVYVVAEAKDAVWPDAAGVAFGSEGSGTWTTAEMRDASAKLAGVINIVATTTNALNNFECGSVAALFGGVLPRKFCVFITHNTGQNLQATGSVVTVSGITTTVA